MLYPSPARLSAFVVDDDTIMADSLAYKLEDLNYNVSIAAETDVRNFDQAAQFLLDRHPAAVICDHRLRDGGFQYDGAQLVAALFEQGVPSLLVTQYLDLDIHVSIRRYRRHIPVVLARDEVSSESISIGLEFAKRELQGNIDVRRRPHHVLLEIDHVDREYTEPFIDVMIDSWRPHHAVRLPISLIPETYHKELKPAAFLYADVNIGAEDSEELYVDNIEWGGFLDEESNA